MDERIGMTMRQVPVRSVLAIDFHHAQRPVLIGQTANLGCHNDPTPTTRPWGVHGNPNHVCGEPSAPTAAICFECESRREIRWWNFSEAPSVVGRYTQASARSAHLGYDAGVDHVAYYRDGSDGRPCLEDGPDRLGAKRSEVRA